MPGRISKIIEGMPHGGMSEKMRKSLTGFGSGSRGIIGMSNVLIKALKGVGKDVPLKSMAAAEAHYSRSTVSSALQIMESLNTIEIPELGAEIASISKQLRMADRAGHQGIVIVNRERIAQLSMRRRRGVLLHERAHIARHEAGLHGQPMKYPSFMKKDIQTISAELQTTYTRAGYPLTSEHLSEELFAWAHESAYLRRWNYKPAIALDKYKTLSQLSAFNPMPTKNIINAKKASLNISRDMQHTTDMVKANITGMTVPGLAQHPRRGGSRQGRRGGT